MSLRPSSCAASVLPPEDAPYERQDKLPSLAEREKEGVARLGAFFERFAAMKKAEAETKRGGRDLPTIDGHLSL